MSIARLNTKDLPQKRLKELLEYDPQTGIFVWKKKRRGFAKKGDQAGCANLKGYISIKVDGRKFLSHRLAWLYIHGYFPENQIDHIDRNPSNNRINNLREVSQSCNSKNCGISTRNKSGITGVSWDKSKERWRAGIKANGKNMKIGIAKSKEEAAWLRWKAETKYDWPNCNTTSSAYMYLKERGLL